MNTLDAALVAHLAASVSAVLFARQRRAYLPVAALLGVTLVASRLRAKLSALVFTPVRLARLDAGADPWAPFTEPVEIVAVGAEVSLFMVGFAGLAMLALWHFRPLKEVLEPSMWVRVRLWLPAVTWRVLSLGIWASYPIVRGLDLQRVYLAANLGALATVVVMVARWVLRRERLMLPQIATGYLGMVQFVSLVAGPWRATIFVGWRLEQLILLVAYIVLTVFHALALWRERVHQRNRGL